MSDRANHETGAERDSAPQDVQQPFTIREILIGGFGFMAFLTMLVVAVNAIGVDRLQAFIEDAGVFAPLVYIGIKAVTYIFAPLTSGPIQVVAGTLFGNVWLGTLYTLIGEVLGGSISFWIARRYGQPVVRRFVGEKGMQQVEDFYAHQMGGWLSLAIARVILFSLWDFLSYAAGLARNVRYTTYLAVSVILGAIPTFAFVWMGSSAIEDTRALYLIYGLVAAMVLLPIAGRKTIGRLLQWAGQQGKRKQKDH